MKNKNDKLSSEIKQNQEVVKHFSGYEHIDYAMNVFGNCMSTSKLIILLEEIEKEKEISNEEKQRLFLIIESVLEDTNELGTWKIKTGMVLHKTKGSSLVKCDFAFTSSYDACLKILELTRKGILFTVNKK